MPIHFYCVYCDKQLGIATRKAGQVVTCPNCKKQIRVPSPEEDATEKSPSHAVIKMETPPNPMPGIQEVASSNPVGKAPVANVFEQSNFSEILGAPLPPVTKVPPVPMPAQTMSPPVPVANAHVVSMAIDLPKPQQAALPPVRLSPPVPVQSATGPKKPGLYLSPSRATALVVLFVFLVAGAFVVGMIVGRILAQ